VQAAEWSVWIEPLTDDESLARELRLGYDNHARLLETVVVVFDCGDEMVHPRHARPKEIPRPLAVTP
jgi:hypothetical protein